MLLKFGVDISRLSREIRRALPIIHSVHLMYGREAVITSTYEGTHGYGSLHYSNNAIDLRLYKNKDIVKQLKKRLGSDFDVVAEADHCHIEYDPKEE
jgi:hypothetical protein